MDLYVLDKEFNVVGLLDNYYSLRWIRRYYRSGEFELHCALTPDTLYLLQRDNIVYKKGIEAGYIEYRQLKQDTEGKEILVVRGKFLTGYLNRRIIWGTEILNTTTENAMRTLITKNCISPSDSNRTINNLALGDLKNYTHTVNYQVSYKNLLDELEKLSNLSNLGYRLKFDLSNKNLIFEIYEGLNRSINQTTNSRAIFSKEFDNILEQEYTDSLNNYRNLAFIGGVGEGTDRKFATVGNSTGLNRYELFVDAKDISNADEESNNISDTDYIKMLIERGNSKLAETKEVQTFDSKININSNIKYKTDYDLGDIVTCISKKWGITIDTRITEIEEIYEENGFNVNIIFGNNIPTLIDKIKQIVR